MSRGLAGDHPQDPRAPAHLPGQRRAPGKGQQSHRPHPLPQLPGEALPWIRTGPGTEEDQVDEMTTFCHRIDCDTPITGTPVTDPDDRAGRRFCSEECLTAEAELRYGYGVAT